MAIHMKGNYIFVNQGEPCFLVSSNFTNYIEIGSPSTNDFYLVGYIDKGQHLIDAALFDKTGKPLCKVIKNHLEEIRQGEWEVKTRVDGGFLITNPSDEILMKVKIDKNKVCLIEGQFYNKSGECVAKGNGQDLFILKGPAILGKSGLARGIVISA